MTIFLSVITWPMACKSPGPDEQVSNVKRIGVDRIERGKRQLCVKPLKGLAAHREDGGYWTVDALGAPHGGERPEKELIASFVDKIAALSPQLVTFNGSSFDLPVLR